MKRRLLLTGLLAACVCSGCGKHDLTSSGALAPPERPHHTVTAQRHPTDAPVGLPRPLTPAVARAFAKAVELVPADVTGSAPQARAGHSPRAEAQAAKCGSVETELGGAHSPELVRGPGLERESISSSVVVLASASMVGRELTYLYSRAGIECYGRALRNIINAEHSGRVSLDDVRVARLQVLAPAAQASTGIRITARLHLPGSGLAVALFVDELSFGYGPAEVQLYTTSFVQPVPVKVEQQLLTLLRERARQHPL